jgi:hypothetical protein
LRLMPIASAAPGRIGKTTSGAYPI